MGKYKVELLAELKGNDEQVYHEIARAFYTLGMEKTMDSVWAIVKKKFPRGIYARNTLLSPIYDEKDPLKKEKLYLAWAKRFPMEKLGEDIVYDYARSDVGTAWASAGQADKAMAYAKTLTSKMWRSEGYSVIANTLKQGGYTKEALELYKMAVENVEKLQQENPQGARFAMIGYPSYLSNYADLCYRLGNKEEAASAMEKLPANRRTATYAEIMADAGRSLEAFLCLLDIVRGGNFNADLLAQMRELYVKMNSTDKGFDSYIEGIRSVRMEEMRQKIAKDIISEPAPDFTLTDTEGKKVKLSDLRGKVVVLDFWATWCGPCKAMGPLVDRLAEEFEGRIEVGKYNCDDESDFAGENRVMSIPAFLFFKDGKKTDIRLAGSQSYETLVEKANALLSL